jgi:hypothetical protein
VLVTNGVKTYDADEPALREDNLAITWLVQSIQSICGWRLLTTANPEEMDSKYKGEMEAAGYAYGRARKGKVIVDHLFFHSLQRLPPHSLAVPFGHRDCLQTRSPTAFH